MSRYLRHVHIEHYGALTDYDIGPFSPGLNVVYGPNEAGKSTIASFVGGVLFGWEEAHGVRNTYRSASGERSGKLTFADDEQGAEFELTRTRNEDGLLGEGLIVADIDHATYRTMFSISSDELRSLRNTSDVTARLLTAGSGTGASPAGAFVEIEQRIAALTSKSPGDEESIFGLMARIEDKRALMETARTENGLYKQQDRERADLAEQRAAAAAQLDEANAEMERMHEARARLQAADAQLSKHRDQLSALSDERSQYVARMINEQNASPELVALDQAAERGIRDKLEEFEDEQAKILRTLETAQENSASSSAAYEALVEMDDDALAQERSLKDRTPQIIVSVLFPLVFILSGVPLFVHGRTIHSLSFTALGIGLVVLACFMAAAALVALLRPNRGAEALEQRRKDAQWVMLQDKKKLDAGQAAKEDFDRRLAAYLESVGLGSAGGSLRQARSLLDEARDERVRATAFDQRLASLDMRMDAQRDAIDAAVADRMDAARALNLDSDAPLASSDALIRKRAEERDALSAALDGMNVRFGELNERLDAARHNHALDLLKYEYQELCCRLREAKRELAMLLLAKRMLEKGIVAWESHNQPEVYAQASRLFAILTDGAWTKVSMTGEGRLTATAADGSIREVRHLSLGTCQQLYLALRVAMLEHATNVGAAIPVLADDILVNFDAQRRRAAARVLAELARVRQVIVFTCHRETAEALQAADPESLLIDL